MNTTIEVPAPARPCSPRTSGCSATACTSLRTAKSVRWSAKWTSTPRSRDELIESCSISASWASRSRKRSAAAARRFFHAILAVEALSRVDPSIGVLVDVQNTLVINALLRWGNDEQKRATCRRLASTRSARTRCPRRAPAATRSRWRRAPPSDGDHWVLTGRKLWITNAAEAELFIVFANVEPEARATAASPRFSSSAASPGFAVGKKEDKLGIRASSTCELLLEECRVPRANVLGEVGKGYKVAIETLNEGRIGIGAQMVGLAQGALDHTIKYTSERKQFGKSIAEFQAVQHQLARAATEIEAARLMVYEAARLRDAGQPFLTEAAMCKMFSSEVAERVTSLASSSTAATASSRTIRSRSCIATRRSARSTRARRTCNCRRSRSRSSESKNLRI